MSSEKKRGKTPSPHKKHSSSPYKPYGSKKKKQAVEWTSTKVTLNFEDSKILDGVQLKTILERILEEQEKRAIPLLTANLRFAKNKITDLGVRIIVDFLLENRAKIQVKKLFLHKNMISDEGAFHLAELIDRCRYPLAELHLSHNYITSKGARKIFEAVKTSNLYFRLKTEDGTSVDQTKPERKSTPLWLRLEWNCIKYQQAKSDLEELEIVFCSAETQIEDKGGNRAKNCSPFGSCLQSVEVAIHLFLLDLQSQIEEDASLIKEFENLRITPVPNRDTGKFMFR
jgi:hypothetical protein